MTPIAGDIQRVHSSFGQVDELVERRRAIYELALDLADPLSSAVRTEVLDNPAVRAHLGEVLSGAAEYDARHLQSVNELARIGMVDMAPGVVRVAATSDAAQTLDGGLRRLGAGLGGLDDETGPPALVLATSAAFDGAVKMLGDGVRLALDIAPELVGDLLPHVALFAVLSTASAGRLGSASVREFPGLILLPEPRSALEVAEALVHEGAHQMFFDLVLTRSILGASGGQRFAPPWAADGAPAWPFEQVVAAFHAYSCLAALARTLGGRALHAGSLLPVAAERGEVLGSWLHERGGHILGVDGQALVGALTGRSFDAPAAPTDGTEAMSRMARTGLRIVSRRCGNWTLRYCDPYRKATGAASLRPSARRELQSP